MRKRTKERLEVKERLEALEGKIDGVVDRTGYKGSQGIERRLNTTSETLDKLVGTVDELRCTVDFYERVPGLGDRLKSVEQGIQELDAILCEEGSCDE